MGLYDRDYYQDDDPSQEGFFAPRATGQRLMATNIVIVTTVFWIADQLGEPGWLSAHLSLRADLFERPLEFYRLLTYGLTHSALGERPGVLHILFNMFILWIAGRDVEAKYGRFEFLRFYTVAMVLAGLAWLGVQGLVDWLRETGVLGSPAVDARLVGASGAVSAVLFLNIVNWPRRQLLLFFVFPVAAWKVGVGIVAIEVLLMFVGSGEVAYEAHLAGAAFGAAYGRFGWNLGRGASGWDVRRWMDRLKPRPKLKVHDPESYYYDLDREADALLAKIHRQGEESLTDEERRKLEDYSRRMRQKHR